jgi:tetratricopeptide (TPR) repeat protein
MAVDESPYRAEFLANLGTVRWLQNRYDECYDLLTTAYAKGYESNLMHYILGTVGLTKGEFEDAVRHLKKASASRFPYRDLYLSIALRSCGKTKAADKTYRNFIRRNPDLQMISQLSK